MLFVALSVGFFTSVDTVEAATWTDNSHYAVVSSLNKDQFEVGEELVHTLSMWLHLCWNLTYVGLVYPVEWDPSSYDDDTVVVTETDNDSLKSTAGVTVTDDIVGFGATRCGIGRFGGCVYLDMVTLALNTFSRVIPDVADEDADLSEGIHVFADEAIISASIEREDRGVCVKSQGTARARKCIEYGTKIVPFTISDSYTVTKPATPTLSFTATPDIVEKGETTTLEWSSENTVSCTGTTHQEEYPVNVSQNVAPFIGGNLLIPVSNTFSAPSVVNNTPYYGFTNGITSGTVAKTLNYTTTYTVTCEGLNGEEVSASHTVTVDRPETTVSLSGPSTIERGQSANLSWNTENASVCYAEASPKNEKWGGLTTIENGGAPSYSPGFVGPRITTGPPVVYGLQLDDVNGSTLSSPVTEDTTFTINCRPSDNDTIAQVTDSITVTVTEPGEEDDPNNGSDPDGDTTPGPGGEGDFSISCTLPNGEDTTYPVNEDIVITITAPSIPSTYDFTITENGSYTPYTTSNTDSLTPAIKFLTTGTKNIEVTATNAEGVVDVCSFEDIVISVDPEFEEA